MYTLIMGIYVYNLIAPPLSLLSLAVRDKQLANVLWYLRFTMFIKCLCTFYILFAKNNSWSIPLMIIRLI